jgi:hypothetical protein
MLFGRKRNYLEPIGFLKHNSSSRLNRQYSIFKQQLGPTLLLSDNLSSLHGCNIQRKYCTIHSPRIYNPNTITRQKFILHCRLMVQIL